jgi:arsenate reductase (glutaredoxin)
VDNVAMSSATIYHNPKCGTSRNTLALLRERGIEPEIIHYLETPPTRERLVELIQGCGLNARGMLRDKGDLYDTLQLADPALSDNALIDAMMAHPVLINRPIVVTPKGIRLCRPMDKVLDIL